MKKKAVIISFILLLLIIPLVHAATDSSSTGSTDSTDSTSSTDPSSLVVVSSVSMDPEVFYPDEVGTITVTLTNSGTTSVGLSNPEILSDKVHIMNQDVWNTVSYIGLGSTTSYSFSIKADPPDGNTYALFSIGTKDGGSIHQPIIIKVDSTDIKAYISETPDAFPRSAKESVNLTIVNSRAGKIHNIQVIPSGDGDDVSQSEKYIASLENQFDRYSLQHRFRERNRPYVPYNL